MNANPHVTELLSAYLDNRANAAERARVDAHLRDCAQCRADLAQMGYTVRMVRELPTVRRARSYTLPASARVTGGAPAWLSRAVGFATAGLALMLCVVLSADLGLTMMGGGAAAPVPMAQAPRSPQADAATDQARNEAKAMPTSAAAGAAPAPTVVAISRPSTAALPAVATPLPAQPTTGPTATPPTLESHLTPPAAAPTVLRSAAPTASPMPGVPPSAAGVATATVTATMSPTATAVPSATATPSATPTRTATPTAAPTATAVPVPTVVPAPTSAPVGALVPSPALRALEVALGGLVLGGLALFLLLRGWRT